MYCSTYGPLKSEARSVGNSACVVFMYNYVHTYVIYFIASKASSLMLERQR